VQQLFLCRFFRLQIRSVQANINKHVVCPFLAMDYELRNRIWVRDRGICQNCKRKLFQDPYKVIVEELSTLKGIPIFKWSKKCWKCQRETPIVTYDFTVGYSFRLGDIEKLNKILMQRYPFVKKMLSKTMGTEVIANTCVHCGSLQGNWFVGEDLIEMATDGVDMNKLVDLVLPNNLTFQDLPIEKQEISPFRVRLSIGHIHHKDGNPKNDDSDNLVLLCRDCHEKIHSRMDKNVHEHKS